MQVQLLKEVEGQNLMVYLFLVFFFVSVLEMKCGGLNGI